MADDQKFTKEQLDKAVSDAVAALDVDGLKAKVAEALDEAKEAKRKLRAASEIKPEDMQAAEERADKAERELADVKKQVGTLTKERDGAVKALETEQGAARNYALEAEINGAIASGNVVPALVPGLKAMLATQAKADLVDGKYAVTIGDKPAKDHITSFLDSEEGKAYKSASVNGGGGAPGGDKGGGGGKTMDRKSFDALDHAGRSTFVKDGGKVVDQAA